MTGKTWIMREPNEEDGSSEQSYTVKQGGHCNPVIQDVDNGGSRCVRSQVVGKDMVQAVHRDFVRFVRHGLVVQTIDKGSDIISTAHLLLRIIAPTSIPTGLLGCFFANTSSVSIPLSASLRICGANLLSAFAMHNLSS